MILWTIKQLLSVRKALTGRANPSELAWGLALGVAIGLVPKGNLISLLLIGLAISLRINHGMAALSAVGISFLAVYLDPLTHQLGSGILQSPQTRQTLDRWWNLPLMPWTDLNNTVVMGSVVAAGAGVLPTFLVSLPIFRWLAPRQPVTAEASVVPDQPSEAALLVDAAHPTVRAAHPAGAVVESPTASAAAKAAQAHTNSVETNTMESSPAVGTTIAAASSVATADAAGTVEHRETHIDIIRLSHPLPEQGSGDETSATDSQASGSMNEALGYLLRRLKDTRQGKAA